MQMSLIKRFTSRLKSFGNAQGGSVMAMTAILVPAVFLSAGAAFDVTRMFQTRSHMNNALDAAILLAGNNLSRGMPVNARFRREFEQAFEANFQGRNGTLPPYKITSFNASSVTGEISARVESSIDASITRLAGYETLDIASESTAVFKQVKTEVAMMLDITGSMGGQKIRDLKTAANSALNILLSDQNKRVTRVGLVPYASSVNLGRKARIVTRGNDLLATAGAGVSFISNNVPTNDCVTERGGREAATDAHYRNAPLGSDFRTVNGITSGTRLKCPVSRIQPMTNRKARLKREINRMSADGYTAGHIGVAWSYYMLSEKWKNFWPSESRPSAYSDEVKKIAIVMTDGEFNTAYDGVTKNPFGSQKTKSSKLARDICENMKAAKKGNPGITIYSVAFDAPKDARELLRDCASEDTHAETFYYEAQNGQELTDAFRAIANSIQKLRLTR